MTEQANNNTLEYAGGWHIFKFTFVIAAFLCVFPRFFQIKDIFPDIGMRFVNGYYKFAGFYEINTTEAYLLCIGILICLCCILFGGKLFHAGIIVFLTLNYIYLTSEALNIKAYDRILFFMSIVLFVSPAYKKNLLTSNFYPHPRRLMLIIFSSIYLSTGILKLLYEPTWFNGQAMVYHLNHQWHAGGILALKLSTYPMLCFFFGITTILFEVFAGVFIWLPKFNPYILTVGFLFHLGIAILMNVGPFSIVALAAYPILLEPRVLKNLLIKFKVI